MEERPVVVHRTDIEQCIVQERLRVAGSMISWNDVKYSLSAVLT